MKEGTGTLWHDNETVVHRKGSFLINGKKRYGGILESTNDQGEKKYEFFVCAGLIYVNSEDEKQSEKSPDIGGPITLDNKKYKFGGWAKESERGNPYTSIGLKEDEPKEEKAPF